MPGLAGKTYTYMWEKKHKAQRLGWAKYLIYWLQGQDLNL